MEEGIEGAVGDLEALFAVANAEEEVPGVADVLLDAGGNVDTVAQNVGDYVEVGEVDDHEPPEIVVLALAETEPIGTVGADGERGNAGGLGSEAAHG